MVPLEHRILRIASKSIPRECPVKVLQEKNRRASPLNLEILIKNPASYTCNATVTCKQPQENNDSCDGCVLRTGKRVDIEQFQN